MDKPRRSHRFSTEIHLSRTFLVAAVTGRALAASALRGGYDVVVTDCFADRDTRVLARRCRSIAGRGRGGALRCDARALLAAASELAPPERSAGLVYGSGFEGRVRLLERLAAGRRLYGNAPAVVAAVRDIGRFCSLLDRLDIPHPETRRAPPLRAAGEWLVKHAGGAGGAHVRRAGKWRGAAGAYYQRFEPGASHSALFLADGRRATILGFNEQWTVRVRRGRPFLYGGAVSGSVLPRAVEIEIRAKLDALVAATGLVGLNGLDFLLAGDRWLALEVNPRPTATMELYDPDYPRGLFERHLHACEGRLPSVVPRPGAVRAHAVVYALARGHVSAAFVFPQWCRDVPNPGTRFVAGDPVCTVHAAAADRGRAVTLVRRREAALQRALVEVAA
jgi:uncharacterized protein